MKFLRPFKFLPDSREGGGILPWVIAVMTFLSALSLAAGFAVYNASGSWTSDLRNNLSVQITHSNVTERDRQVALALDVLKATTGVSEAVALGEDELVALLEPWLGIGNVTSDLPVPAMISVLLSPEIKLDLIGLEARVRQVAPDARIDDHQQWIGQLAQLSSAVQMATGLAVFLIALTTVAIVIFATHARMASHRDSIEIIHLIGAEDRIIAGEFRYRFMIYGLKGGIAGFVIAGATIWALTSLSKDMGAGFLPQLTLQLDQVFIIAGIPFMTALLTLLTANWTVKRALGQMM
jgi:cell division transport system permease protein